MENNDIKVDSIDKLKDFLRKYRIFLVIQRDNAHAFGEHLVAINLTGKIQMIDVIMSEIGGHHGI